MSSDVSLLRAKGTVHLSPSYLAHKDDAPSMEAIQRAATDLIHALVGLVEKPPAGGARHLTQRVGLQLRRLGLELLQLGLPHANEGAVSVSTVLQELRPALERADGATLADIRLVEMKLDDALWLRRFIGHHVQDETTRARAREVLGSPEGNDVREAAQLLEAITRMLSPANQNQAQGVGKLVWACHELASPPPQPLPSALATYLVAALHQLHQPLFHHFKQTASAELRAQALNTTDSRLDEPRAILRLLQKVEPGVPAYGDLLRFLG